MRLLPEGSVLMNNPFLADSLRHRHQKLQILLVLIHPFRATEPLPQRDLCPYTPDLFPILGLIFTCTAEACAFQTVFQLGFTRQFRRFKANTKWYPDSIKSFPDVLITDFSGQCRRQFFFRRGRCQLQDPKRLRFLPFLIQDIV